MILRTDGVLTETEAFVPDQGSIGWLHLKNPTDDEVKRLLGDIYGCHPLVLEDVMHFGQRPKVDHYPHQPNPHAFISFYGLDVQFHAIEFCIIIAKQYLITVTRDELPFLDRLYQRAKKDWELLSTTGKLLYHILDECVDEYFLIMDDLEQRLDRLEERVFHHPEKESAPEIFRWKRRLHKIRRLATDGRNVIGVLAHETFPFTDEPHSVYFVDVYDHASRVVDALDAVRDALSGLLDLQTAQRANKMNEVMKTLTVISTIFLPLSFIVGWYGMNVKIPEYNWTYGYLWVVSLMVVVTCGFVYYFKRKGWW